MSSTEHGAAVAKFFDGWAQDGHAERMERGHSARAEEALRSMPLKQGQSALDLGCGNGWATRWIHDCVALGGGSAVGVDLASEMVAKASQIAPEVTSLSFQRADFSDMPFDSGTFDHVFSMEAIYYVDDVPRTLDEIRRVLGGGGCLTLCMDYFTENPYCVGWPELTGLTMQLFSENRWKDMLRAAGFSQIRAFRCFDARPIPEDLDRSEAEELRHFREEIGSLALQAFKAGE